MKKKLVTLLLSTCLILTSCGTKETVIEKEPEAAAESSVEGEIEVDKNLLSVEVTIPKKYLGNEEITQESLDETAAEMGIDSATLNEDGSITYKMSKSAHSELLNEIKTSIEESCNDMINGEKAVESFEKITFNDDMTKFSVHVDKAKWSDFDSLNALAFYMSGAYYQLFSGVYADDVDVQVDFIDNSTNEIFDMGKLSDMEDTTSFEETPDEKEMIKEISNWYTEIWNYFVDFQSYIEYGTDCTGSEIDIDFAYSQFEAKYVKKAEYNKYIIELSDDYSSIKSTWEKMNEQIEIIHSDIAENGVKKGGEEIKLDLLNQYGTAFHDYVWNLE